MTEDAHSARRKENYLRWCDDAVVVVGVRVCHCVNGRDGSAATILM